MLKTYEILKTICKLNPEISHFLLRLYKHKKGLPNDPDKSFEYVWLHVSEIKSIKSKIVVYESGSWSVGLTSVVMTQFGIKHLLMLDYAIVPSSNIEKQLVSKLSLFNKSGDVSYKINGYLIQTKNSYHYLGKFVTSEENLINFFGSALLFRDSDQSVFVVDDRWIGHSIKRKFGVIRLGKKDGIYPQVIAEIN